MIALCGALLLAPAAGRTQSLDSLLDARWQRTPVSPRIAELTRQASSGDRDAGSRFWSFVSSQGTPLIEIGPDTATSLVTFVWQSVRPVRVAAVVDFGQSALRMLLQRVSGTDVWFRTYRVPSDARFLYTFSVDDPNFPFEFGDSTAWPAVTRLDPLNKKSWGSPPQLSLAELPRAPAMPWRTSDASRPRGVVVKITVPVKSTVLGNERNAFLYRPAGYADSLGPYPLLVFGASYISQIRLPAILDYLIAEKRVPPVVVAYFDWPAGRQDIESGCEPPFGDFLATEFLPFIRGRVRVATDPARVIIGGASAGGFSAACVAFRHPEAFGNVLSQSGAFWRGLGNTASFWTNHNRDDAERVWFPRAVAVAPRVPVRFHLSVGVLEQSGALGSGGISMVQVNRQLRDVVIAKGYDVIYREVGGAHDPYNWEIALPGALELLLGRK